MAQSEERAMTWLGQAGLRPTRQRVALAELLVGDGKDRHVTAESLFDSAKGQGVAVSLATVYNTLHQFTEAGILRQVVVDGAKTYFDTNTNDHHHFFVEGDGRLLDIPGEQVAVEGVPGSPDGYYVDRVDVVVRLKPKRAD